MKKIILNILFLCVLAPTLWAQNQNLSNGFVFDGEPYLAINPTNSQHVVVAWMGWISVSNRFQIKVKTSFDGGQSWSGVTELPHTVTGYSSADPCIEFNNNGEVFISYIDFTGTEPPVTGGIYLCKSIDGGVTWGTPTEVINTNYDGTKWPIDRPWMVIDKSNSSTQGNIYVATFNLNRTNAPYNPYLSVSGDGGNTFTTRYIDTVGWLAGGINPLPMCFPAVSSSGIFYGTYPSYALSQSFYLQNFLASSNNGGIDMEHSTITTFSSPSNLSDYPLAKKGSVLLCNPVDANHLAYVFLSAVTGDLDVYLVESLDGGSSWGTPIRLNDDPVANDRMQDLIWGDFDNDGDLIVTWRDRRNGTDSTFKTETEIWATYRNKDSIEFAPNFQITNQTVVYDSVLENAGNDFMCVKLQEDTLNATWGDTRNGKLNIWFQRMTTSGEILSTNQISSETISPIIIYPNPVYSTITVQGEKIERIELFDNNGKQVLSKNYTNELNQVDLNMEMLSVGSYFMKITTEKGKYFEKIIKEK